MARFSSLIKEYSNATFLVGCCLIAGMVASIWVIESWEYFPEWAPVPGPLLMNFVSCLRPIFLFVCGLPTAIAFLISSVTSFGLLVNRALSKDLVGVVSLILSLTILGASTLPLIYKDQLEDGLQQYAISRYDVVIDAIEKYRADNGHYPPSLETLVPVYLPTVPGKYMKFGERLTYFSNVSMGGYIGHGPFIFELTGMYAGIHGQTLKYCPIQDESCSVFKGRIDDRWIWTYSSIL
ncbi:MAG: hypothetical protein HZC38_03505 [Chloroflexi bacterium]|nr:hypothetical protein [Chloroflexota bacterium]MBI5712483.1 hypothetical protein [Chloroflexota bacterium]